MKKTILYKTLFFCWAILALTGWGRPGLAEEL